MDIFDLLNNEITRLPKKRKNIYFPKYIRSLFKSYLNKIDELDSREVIAAKIIGEKVTIKKFSNHISKAVELNYRGLFFPAYEELAKGLEFVKPYLKYHWTSLEPVKDNRLKLLFRMRIGNDHIFDIREMFHIPFESRTKVQMQRYSIHGLPCLYLGSSSYVCWDELGKPHLNSIQISRLEMNQNEKAKILNLSFTPSYIASKLKDKDLTKHINLVSSFFVIWPLIAACSLKVENREDPFKPEYIVPQMLLQWVRLSIDYDGIKYFSVNVPEDTILKDMTLYQNYVFPVKNPLAKGLCGELKRKFKITHTVLWQEANTHKIILNYPTWCKENRILELIKGFPVNYNETDFGYIEKLLMNMPVNSIN